MIFNSLSRLGFTFSLCLIALQTTSAGIVKGRVKDGSGIMPDASVYVMERNNIGTITDDRGKYKLELPDGKYTICCEFLGYKKICKEVEVKGEEPVMVSFLMEEDVTTMNTVVVNASRKSMNFDLPQMGVAEVNVGELKKMPALFGEQDVIKSLQLMPGVKSESDASGGFQVRGGESSQNLVLLDGATVNNASHLLGMFSPFNSDIMRDVTLYKGALPAQYGGRTSSVLEINTINGDFNEKGFKGDASIGLLASKFSLQGPIIKDKLSYYVSARRTYLDVFLQCLDDFKNTSLYFYDMNAKVSYKIDENDFMFVSFFRGNDNLGLNDVGSMGWSNTVGNLKWWHKFNDNAELNSTFFSSMNRSKESFELASMDSKIKAKNYQLSLKEDLKWKVNDINTMHIGLQSSYLDVISTDIRENNGRAFEERYGWENALWANDEIDLSKRLKASLGLRLTTFSVIGEGDFYTLDEEGYIASATHYSKGEFVKTYADLEPRASFVYKLAPNQNVKAAYARTSQNVHSVRESISALPFDKTSLSTNIIRPERADQISVGYAINIKKEDKNNVTHDDAFAIETEIYYKSMKNVLDYREGVNSTSHPEVDRLWLQGEGRSYGWELNLRKNYGKLSGWISYTLSKTETKIDEINNGKWYNAGNDRTHSISIVALYSYSDKWDFSASWTFNSGQSLSLPTAKYEIEGETVYYYEQKNNYRAPSYHRLDFSATRHGKKHKHWQGEWSFGVYNLYGRYNPFMIYLEDDDSVASGTKATQLSLFSFVPSVSYRIKFNK